ncbi:hypothetical protein ACHQM5_000278 [Ranunculus cassubicifolius]
MLDVFDKFVAKSPEGLKSPESDAVSALKDGFCVVTLNLGSLGLISYSSDKQNPLLPRLFAVVDGIFCLFQGHIENVSPLKQHYGLNKTANEVIIVIEAYRTLRDRGPYPADQVVRDIHGKFAFILYDSSLKSTFVVADVDMSVPFFWGADSEDNVILSDDIEVLKKGYGKSFAPFPKGCFFTTSGGLRSFEHPMNEMKPMPRVDRSGQVCGSTFKVDTETKKEENIPRVGSAANWSANY